MRKSLFTPQNYIKNSLAPQWTELTKGYYVTGKSYQPNSLRKILPDRWGFSYRETVELTKNEKMYEAQKTDLFYKSIILGYGVGPIQRVAPTREIAKYIKEHCSSAIRLKAISLRSYENFANMRGLGQWYSMGWPVYLSLAAAKSSLDAIAAVVWVLVFGKVPKRLPDMYELWKALCPDKKPKLPFGKEFDRVYKSRWYKKLMLARNQVVHRGMWPKYHETYGVALKHDLDQLRDRPPGFYSENLDKLNPKTTLKLIHLNKLMVGFVSGLEKWEQEIASSLSKLSCFESYMTDGIITSVSFNTNGPMMDFGEGSVLMATSPSDELVKIQRRRMRTAQRKVRARSAQGK